MEQTQLSRMLDSYRNAVDEWVITIRAEESLASVEPTVAQLDRWEGAHFAEEIARAHAKQAKIDYEGAVRSMQFGF